MESREQGAERIGHSAERRTQSAWSMGQSAEGIAYSEQRIEKPVKLNRPRTRNRKRFKILEDEDEHEHEYEPKNELNPLPATLICN